MKILSIRWYLRYTLKNDIKGKVCSRRKESCSVGEKQSVFKG